MLPAAWPPPAAEIAYFRDERGTVFAAEVARGRDWSSALLTPPERLTADLRVALLDGPRREPAPPWLVVLPGASGRDLGAIAGAAHAAWPSSPWFRAAPAPPEDYLAAGYQALCPPHPPCAPGLGARDSLCAFLRDRVGVLGWLGDQGRDGFDRLVQVAWPAPEDFATAVLEERMRDAGAGAFVQLHHFLVEARVVDGEPGREGLEAERADLAGRLAPLRYFTHARDFEAAARAAEAWGQYHRRALITRDDPVPSSAPAVAGSPGASIELARRSA